MTISDLVMTISDLKQIIGTVSFIVASTQVRLLKSLIMYQNVTGSNPEVLLKGDR